MYCKNCGDVIDAKAGRCPSCGAVVGRQGRRPSRRRFWLGLVTACIAVLCLLTLNFESLGDLDLSWLPKSSRADDPTDPVDCVTQSGVTLDQVTFYDKDGIRLTALGIRDGYDCFEIPVRFENNTDQDMGFSAAEFVVNGITIQRSLLLCADAGQTAVDMLRINTGSLKAVGIRDIAVLSVPYGDLYDRAEYETRDTVSFTLNTSAAEGYVQPVDDSGLVIYDEGGLTIAFRGVTEEEWETTVDLFIRNSTGKDLMVEVQSITINGKNLPCLMFDTVCGGTVSYSRIPIQNDSLEDAHIQELKNAEATFFLVEPVTYVTLSTIGPLCFDFGD